MKTYKVYINGIDYGTDFKCREWAQELINVLTKQDIRLGLPSPLYKIEEVC